MRWDEIRYYVYYTPRRSPACRRTRNVVSERRLRPRTRPSWEPSTTKSSCAWDMLYYTFIICIYIYILCLCTYARHAN